MLSIRPTNATSDLRNTPESQSVPPNAVLDSSFRQWRTFGLASLAVMLVFGGPLWTLVVFAATGPGSELYSYILLIPFIAGYLLRMRRRDFPSPSSPPRKTAVGFLVAGTIVLGAYWLCVRSGPGMATDGYLAIMMICFVTFLAGAACFFLGVNTLRMAAFPLCFLVFLVPIPGFMLSKIDGFLQGGSAAVAWLFFKVSGTPFISDGLVFQLPGITIRIAPECSGIHSTLIMFITSLLASYMFLRTPWKRALFVLLVIPLGILRNGFRVFVIGELCDRVGPQMIDSPIHHKGGPFFFILALIPLFIILLVLQRSERAAQSGNSLEFSIEHA